MYSYFQHSPVIWSCMLASTGTEFNSKVVTDIRDLNTWLRALLSRGEFMVIYLSISTSMFKLTREILSWPSQSIMGNGFLIYRTVCKGRPLLLAKLPLGQRGILLINMSSSGSCKKSLNCIMVHHQAFSSSPRFRSISFVRSFSSLNDSGTTMLAWQIESYGGNDKLKLVEKPIPIITQPNQVLIKVHASSVNPLDVRMRKGYAATFLNTGRKVKPGGEFPLTLGRDCSGVIVGTGKAVKKFELGQDVWGTVNQISQGAHAQYVLTTEAEISLKPKNLSHVEAASMPYVAITTWSATYAIARFRPENALGRFALVHGGAGGIGSFAIQLLKAWNARVASTCSTDSVDFVRGLGADHVVDYRTTDPEKELRKLGRFDYILDTVGGKVEDYSINLLNGAKGANYVTLVTPIMESIEAQGAVVGSLAASFSLIKKALQTAKIGGKYRWAFATGNGAALKKIATLVEEGKIRPVVNKVFPFTEAPEALKAVELGRAKGKIVIGVIKGKEQQPKKVDIFKES
ncbi:reticulon-4-interacting protein 1, mitochondrial-like [Acanthaster planci]|uniref:Reticulon-4-interacting protein 1, mitochondrial-like n=1 Tax=Acanthaster planci TaxID=133434 RepID=A0A8B7XTL2_ACAPL|nr:reticulon-4-interacting protein 1, mitochondrial-like [Acanthaster planci]